MSAQAVTDSMFADVVEILRVLAPHAILVGSASRGEPFRDIDLVVGAKGLRLAAKLFPEPRASALIGHWKTFGTSIPIEAFQYWYGPDYSSLARKRLGTRILLGVEIRYWPEHPPD